jgi:AcrR family transcriptional regulator
MTSTPSWNVESLRDAQKSLTRTRICDAARDLFNEYGFSTVTLEQIAQAAGTRRSTVYNHFRNKDDILVAIAEEYGDGMLKLIAELPAPRPSREEIDCWTQKVAEFTVKEKTPTVLLMRLGDQISVPEPIQMLERRIMKALADHLPAFKQAIETGPQQGLALARAGAAIHQLGWACLNRIRHGKVGIADDLLTVAAEVFERFFAESCSTLSRGQPDS